jgi:hypothetical protein
MPSSVIEAIRSGAVPAPAKLAAARALLPLTPEETLEALVLLSRDEAAEVREAALKSLGEFDRQRLLDVVAQAETAPDVLGHLCAWRNGTRELYEALALNARTPDEGIAELARAVKDGLLLELIAVNQQRLIQHPAIIDAIIANPSRTPEAERRAREVREEFFEKELGAQRIAEERRARAAAASAALGLDHAEEIVATLIDDDLAVEELYVDDQLLKDEFHLDLQLEADAYGSLEIALADAHRMAEEAEAAGEMVGQERLTTMQFITRLSIKQRVQLALKGNREARNILKRDSNKAVIVGVLNNPRITESEVEAISTMKTVPEEALRLIGTSRIWTRSYPIIHNLVRNPRTPVAVTLPLLNRLFPKDLKAITGNRNVPEVTRKSAQRLLNARGVKDEG